MSYEVTISDGNVVSVTLGGVTYNVTMSQVGQAGRGISSIAIHPTTGVVTVTYTDTTTAVFDTFEDVMTAESTVLAAKDVVVAAEANVVTLEGQAEGHATTAAAEAADALSAVSWQDLSAINSTYNVTAVAGCRYDTTQDSDGGEWVNNCQDLSWENEDRPTGPWLGYVANETAARAVSGAGTGAYYHNSSDGKFYQLSAGSGQVEIYRGAERQFPIVADITAEAGRVIIWDALTGAMWMVFYGAGNQNIIRTTMGSIAADNGYLSVGHVGGNSLNVIRFISDGADRHWSSSQFSGQYQGTIAERNDSKDYSEYDLNPIKSTTVNDVAMTVLPNAPTDPTTGLKVPTIAVATDGGVSVINDDGTVVDSGSTSAKDNIDFSGTRLVYTQKTSEGRWSIDASDLQDGFTPTIYDSASNNGWFQDADVPSAAKASGMHFLSGDVNGLSVILENPDTPANGAVARITSEYSTGFQVGEIKGAFLASTDTADLVGSGELVTNGDFATNDLTGYTDGSVGTGSVDASSGAAVITSTDGSNYGKMTQTLTGLVVGHPYILSFTVSGSQAYVVGQDTTGNYDAGTHVLTIVPNSSSEVFDFLVAGNNGTSTIDNISAKLADPDRSVNANGLIINGTINRDPVAAGAELVGYSGFSADDYFEQPYNPSYDFGTGDFHVMGWVNATSYGYAIQRLGSTKDNYVYVKPDGKIEFGNTGGGNNYLSGSTVTFGNWAFFCAVREAGVKKLYVNGSLEGTSAHAVDLSDSDAITRVGCGVLGSAPLTAGSLARLRIGATAPSAAQIKAIYDAEKHLFKEGAQATLHGSSDAVTALTHDKATDLLHVGTSGGMSTFKGLRRIDQDDDAVTTFIAADGGSILRQ